MPKPMHRSSSFRRLDRTTPQGRHVIHYKRRRGAFPHCAICRTELTGIRNPKSATGRSPMSNSRLFGGVLCPKCTSEVIKSASRIEHGEIKLNDIGIRQRAYVLQMISH